MTDFFRTKENEFYIELKEERYYIPGEDISGDVILDLKKATKTNNIKVTLEGIAEIAGRTLTLFTRNIVIAESLDGQRSYYLEPHTHRFPFRIAIPSSKTHKVPSTLKIPRILEVSYMLTATYNKTYAVLEKLCPTASVNVNVLEDINVEKEGLLDEKKMEKQWKLRNKKLGKVCVCIGKRAAVKGDIVPISVKVDYNGVLNKKKGISVQLLRSIYYGRHRSDVYGPKIMREISSDIYMPGDSTGAKTMDMKLPIPSQLCPTVDKSGQSFKIEYSIRIKVNLNEPNRPESKGDTATFDTPFIIGTYPKIAFNIDDDYEEEDKEDIDANEYDQIAEKMKNMDFLESDITTTNSEPNSPEMNRQDDISRKDSVYSHRMSQAPAQRQGTVTRIDPTLPSLDDRKNKPLPLTPIYTNQHNPSSAPMYNGQYVDVLSPPIEKLSPNMSYSPNGLYPPQQQPMLSPINTNFTQPSNTTMTSPLFMQGNINGVHRSNTTSSSGSSGHGSMYQPSPEINSRPASLNYHMNPSRHSTVHVSQNLGRQESLNNGPNRHESVYQPNTTGRQESFHHLPNVSLGRQESVRWVAPPPINHSANPPYMTTQEPGMSMPTPFLPPPPPPPPQQQQPFMGYPRAPPLYPPDNSLGGFPIPEHDPVFPSNNNGFFNMPSAANYQQPPYPFYPQH